MLFYPIRKDSQSHHQILMIDDQNLTVLDFLDSHLTHTTLLQTLASRESGAVTPSKRLQRYRNIQSWRTHLMRFVMIKLSSGFS